MTSMEGEEPLFATLWRRKHLTKLPDSKILRAEVRFMEENPCWTKGKKTYNKSTVASRYTKFLWLAQTFDLTLKSEQRTIIKPSVSTYVRR